MFEPRLDKRYVIVEDSRSNSDAVNREELDDSQSHFAICRPRRMTQLPQYAFACQFLPPWSCFFFTPEVPDISFLKRADFLKNLKEALCLLLFRATCLSALHLM